MRIIIMLIIGLTWAEWAQSNPVFHASQPIAGRTTTSWSFMTAWNLTTRGLEASPRWYDGRSAWQHAAPTRRQWIARFIYDDASRRTRELAWYYSQIHVQ